MVKNDWFERNSDEGWIAAILASFFTEVFLLMWQSLNLRPLIEGMGIGVFIIVSIVIIVLIVVRFKYGSGKGTSDP